MIYPTIRASIKFILFIIMTATLIVPHIIIFTFHKGKGSYLIPNIWQKLTCYIFAIKVSVKGKPTKTDQQTIYVSNHVSYLDIPVIGSVLQGSFVAKSDVRTWPLFGFLAALQQTAFISRNRTDAEKEKNNLGAMLQKGKNLILFPEGTSTEGRNVLPFKSSLFSIATGASRLELLIQPFTLNVIKVDKQIPIQSKIRDLYAWHINMDIPMHHHLWDFAKSHGALIELVFHTPISPKIYSDRKSLAIACHKAVSNGINL